MIEKCSLVYVTHETSVRSMSFAVRLLAVVWVRDDPERGFARA
jgi:hypothetical protein